jgi:hypothetical protein
MGGHVGRPRGMTTEERFWEKVTKGPDCWEWTGGRSTDAPDDRHTRCKHADDEAARAEAGSVTRSHPVTDDTVTPEARLREAAQEVVSGWFDRVELDGPQMRQSMLRLRAALAATSSPEPGLDVERLARALFAVHPLMYPQSWPDDDPDDIGPDPTEDATAIAAEYARLASENRSA